MSILWRLTWWRYLVIVLVLHGPQRLSDWLWCHSGLSEGLEQLFRGLGDWDMVRQTRAVRRRLEAHYGR